MVEKPESPESTIHKLNCSPPKGICQIVQLHLIYHLCYLAEDVVEEVFLNVWEKQDGHYQIKEVERYLFLSVKHNALRLILQNSRQFLNSDYQEAESVADTVNPEEILMGHELEAIIAKATASLSPLCALVYDLIKNKGKTYQEVATELELGVSKKTLEGHISKALATIRKDLSCHFDENQTNYLLIVTISGRQTMRRKPPKFNTGLLPSTIQ